LDKESGSKGDSGEGEGAYDWREEKSSGVERRSEKVCVVR